MKLTHRNYFTKKNNYLTSSKIKDFIRSREYFYKKHIEHSIEKKPTDAMIMGSMIDTIITESKEKFEKLFVPVSRRNKKNPPKTHTEVTPQMYQDAIRMAEKVLDCPAYKSLKKYKTQQILQVDMPEWQNFEGAAGVLDFLGVDKKANTADIGDFKTSVTADPMKYYYRAKDLGYHIQMAWYGVLVRNALKIPYENITYRHLVLEKGPDGIYKIGTFIFDRAYIDETRAWLLPLAKNIASCTDWSDPKAVWEEATVLTAKGPKKETESADDVDWKTLPS